jgi:hypothetical protein
MTVSSVGNLVGNFQTQAFQAQMPLAQVHKAARDSDGDTDGSGPAEATSAPGPTVNLGGQKIGALINVTA